MTEPSTPDERSELAHAVAARAQELRVARPPERLEAEARLRAIRRLRWSLVTAGVIVSIGLIVFVIVVVRDKPVNECLTMLGPLPATEQLVGYPLRIDEGIAGERDCDVRVWQRDRIDHPGAPVIVIENKHVNNYERVRADLEGKPFSGSETLTLPVGEALLFIAGAGATQHAVVFRHGDIVTELLLDGRAFDLAKAKSFAAAVAARATP
ncbi:MAG: hypothetical protein H6Q90_1010 [Deltaproteobacteria bacterium]|nr:hypothetical protein [Deltaproteobacteria bacterium]